jgi:hypothetical protein
MIKKYATCHHIICQLIEKWVHNCHISIMFGDCAKNIRQGPKLMTEKNVGFIFTIKKSRDYFLL